MKWPGLLLRVALGLWFAWLGGVKAMDAADFLKQIHAYRPPGPPLLANWLAAIIPWLEIFCGLLLAAGIAVRGTALVLAGMTAVFTGAVVWRAMDVMNTSHKAFCEVAFDCGCGTGVVGVCAKLMENCALISLTLALLAASMRRPGRGRLG